MSSVPGLELGSPADPRASLRGRSGLTVLATLLSLGVAAPDALAAVTATVSGSAPDKLLTVTTSAGDAVVVTCGAGNNVKVNGADPSPATPCAQLGRASVTGDGAANSIDLTAFNAFPFPVLAVTLAGGAGADSLLSGGGPFFSEVSGGPGNDTIEANFSTFVESADANMTLTRTSFTSPALGTDVLSGVVLARLTGGPSANVIDASAFTGPGLSVEVTLDGQGGNDTVSTGAGFSRMTGGPGSDSLVHSGNFDELFDQFSGTTTLTDTGMTTGADTDTFSGPTFSTVRLTGSAGNDDVDVSTFARLAVADGGGGHDTLVGGGFSHILTGGLGDDSFVDTAAFPTSAELSETADADMTLTAGALTGVGNDTLTGIHRARLEGGAGDHTIDASTFPASPGDSVDLDGGAGNDTVRGGPGNNAFAPEPGDDSLVGGGGFNRLRGTRPAGSVTLTNTAFTATLLGDDTISGFGDASVAGSAGPDTMDASAFTGSGGVWFSGRAGADSLVGSTRDDTFVAEDGVDTVRALAGHDTIFDLDNVPGADSFMGDGGDDTLWGEGNNETLDGGTGFDRAEAERLGPTITLTNTSITSPSNTISISAIERVKLRGDSLPTDIDAIQFTGSGGVEVDGGGGDDTMTGSAGARNDSIHGGAGNDRFDAFGDFNFTLTNARLESPGGTGLDTLTAVEGVSVTGGASANLLDASAATTRTTTLLGGGGNDTLRGGALADSLNGEGGVDDFFGGAGDDTLFTQDSLAEAMIFCGSGTNLVTADGADTLAADCPAPPTVPGGGGDPTVPGGGGEAPPPVVPPVPVPVPVPPLPDPTAGVRDGCVEIPPKFRERVKAVAGGGQAVLSISRSNDPTQPLKLTAKARRGLRIASATFTVNGRAVPSSGRSGSAPIAALKLGSRNKVTVTITLANGKKVTVNQFVTVKRCPSPPVKCQRLADGAQIRCSSSVPKRIRAVQLTLFGRPGQSARGRARVRRKRRASKGNYTVTLRPATPLPPGRYVFTQVGTTARKGEKLLAVRVLTLS
jgi:Ca2+-binding RTX toxin-like protein